MRDLLAAALALAGLAMGVTGNWIRRPQKITTRWMISIVSILVIGVCLLTLAQNHLPSEQSVASPTLLPSTPFGGDRDLVDTVELTDQAAVSASWTSAAGDVPFGDNRERGISRLATDVLEDGTSRFGLLTHPSYQEGDTKDFIRGCFKIREPIRNGDWFRADIGFPSWSKIGSARFQVFVVNADGEAKVGEQFDTRADGKLHQLNVSLNDHGN